MSDRHLMLTLAKVVIAAAWSDGEVTHDEINSLKLMLLKLRTSGGRRAAELTGREWAELEIYMDSPVSAPERARLVAELQNALRTGQQKREAMEALREVVAADGVVSEEEQALLAELEEAIDQVAVGLFGAMQRVVGRRMEVQQQGSAGVPNREAYLTDFLTNKVYYALSQRLRQGEAELRLSEEEQRKLGLAGGLMAKLAHVDGDPTEQEFRTMVETIQRHWALDGEAASFVADVALVAVKESFDSRRLMRELANVSSREERRHFLKALFAVAAADGNISLDEHEEIRIIARGIKLTHEEFIQAKLSVLGG